jgi:tetratricopeptide (TPR) repeat protein
MKKRYKILIGFAAIIIGFISYFNIRVTLNPPEILDKSILEQERIKIDTDFYTLNDSWLKKNNLGLWELFVSGNDFELGVINGKLTKELAHYQEEAFVEQLKELVPSNFYINFLKYFIAWFNRDIDKYIPVEYQKEIYGVSLSASNKFEFIAPNYQRILNYHAAHDIGHTISNMNLVACTAFGVKNHRSEDSTLLVGRNMDFYVGDKFAENKIVAFCKPENGYPFTCITWGGFIGVISGMNNQGLTITLNSAKSGLPSSAKTPVSILARMILQYASTIDEALQIANQHETFVAESFFISSAKENDFAIIEKSTDTTALYHQTTDELILTNHFQSEALKNRPLTIENKKTSETVYRWQRAETLLNAKEVHTVDSFVEILRNQKGENGKDIGLGNEMAINQLIAHHSVVFKPKQLQMWISVGPYQLGKYIAYDLNKIFSDSLNIQEDIYSSKLTVKEDDFLYSPDYQRFIQYKTITKKIEKAVDDENSTYITQELIEEYQQLNPTYYYTYFIVGECYKKMGDLEKAKEFYLKALKKDISKKYERDKIQEKLKELSENAS